MTRNLAVSKAIEILEALSLPVTFNQITAWDLLTSKGRNEINVFDGEGEFVTTGTEARERVELEIAVTIYGSPATTSENINLVCEAIINAFLISQNFGGIVDDLQIHRRTTALSKETCKASLIFYFLARYGDYN